MQKLAYKFTLEEAYAYMGLPYGASPEEVKDKYRYLAREYHPDHHPGFPGHLRKQRVQRLCGR